MVEDINEKLFGLKIILDNKSTLIETNLGERIVAKINRLCILQALLATPGLTPKPLLRQALYRHLQTMMGKIEDILNCYE